MIVQLKTSRQLSMGLDISITVLLLSVFGFDGRRFDFHLLDPRHSESIEGSTFNNPSDVLRLIIHLNSI